MLLHTSQNELISIQDIPTELFPLGQNCIKIEPMCGYLLFRQKLRKFRWKAEWIINFSGKSVQKLSFISKATLLCQFETNRPKFLCSLPRFYSFSSNGTEVIPETRITTGKHHLFSGKFQHFQIPIRSWNARTFQNEFL